MTALRRFVVILLLLWFPVQSWAAMAMPLCRHAHIQTQTMNQVQPTACHESGSPAHHPVSGHPVFNCDDCGLCHLTQTSSVTTVLTGQAIPPLREVPHYLASAHRIVSPELPFRPPRA
ncbi:MAG: DUF2946 family protein [Thiobacillaceae bacterium]